VLCDADLSVLAAPDQVYRAYAGAVRQEYAHVPEGAFRTGRIAVLTALGAAPSLFHTEPARRLWETAARGNLAAELVRLADPGQPLDGDDLTPKPGRVPG
jgi:predicted metal-dependent HD superfamily phosphohydrolase